MTKRLAIVFVAMFGVVGFSTADIISTITSKTSDILSTVTSGSILPSISGAPVCGGSFVNPITDICWDCLFPIHIMGIQFVPGKQPDKSDKSIACVCSDPFPRIGIPLEFWEPARLIDVTRKPYCFPNLGGLTLNPGIKAPGGRVGREDTGEDSFFQAHYYIYPLLYWLEIVTNFVCLESSGFDLAYITELDPLWNDDQLTFLLNPEAVLFANPIGQAAGAVDCVATSSKKRKLPMDRIFWMAGCQGSMYPMDGRVQREHAPIQGSLLVAEKLVYKMHRQGLAWGYQKGLCGKYPMPVMKKSQYRTQLINPIPTVGGSFGCNPMGRSSFLYDSRKSYPIKGEDYGYLLWRKRACCAF